MTDHVIIGSGINALVAAAMLALKGDRVLVLEREARLGGCMRTEQVTLPGFIVARDGAVCGAKLGAKAGEIQHHGKARTVGDQQTALAVIDVSPRAGGDDTAEILQALALGVEPGVEQLPVGEAAGEHHNQPDDRAVEEQQARIAVGAAFDESAHE